jgi:hypothetical protein
VDRRAGCGRQRRGELLVGFGELVGTSFFGDVQTAVRHVLYEDRDAEEGAHRRVTVGKPDRLGVPAEIAQSKWFALAITTPRIPRPCGG